MSPTGGPRWYQLNFLQFQFQAAARVFSDCFNFQKITYNKSFEKSDACCKRENVIVPTGQKQHYFQAHRAKARGQKAAITAFTSDNLFVVLHGSFAKF